VPIDQLASVLVELSFNLHAESASAKSRVFHPINPKWVSWKSLIPTVIKALQESTADRPHMKVVKFDEWIKLLRATAAAVTKNLNVGVDVLREEPAINFSILRMPCSRRK
jgi:hypothetical protein